MGITNYSKKVLTLFIVFFCFTFLLSGKINYVDCNAEGSDDGTSWCDAFPDLQDALDDATSGDEIRVASGCTGNCSYKPSKRRDPNDPRSATFQLKCDVVLKGGYAGCCNPEAPRDTLLLKTTLSGDIGTPSVNTDNCYHVVNCTGIGSGSVLDGFEIKDGYANGQPGGNKKGGGLFCNSEILKLVNCTFTSNQAAMNGGGIYLANCELEMVNCFLNDNTAVKGGGLFSYESIIKIRNSTFYGNTATDIGGGFCSTGGTNYFWNCIFYGNSAIYGGGLCVGGWLKFRNGLIYKNTASEKGGGVCINSNASVILICNSILWDDTATVSDNEIYVQSGTLTANYCDVEGGWSGTGNINVLPSFIDPDGEDDSLGTGDDNFRLRADSPLIDAGDNDCYPNGVGDKDGNPRYIDDFSTEDTGIGTPPIIDIGPYEFQDLLRGYFFKTNYKKQFGIDTFPKSLLHIGDEAGLTVNREGKRALSWNAYLDNCWKSLDGGFSAQIAAGYEGSCLEFNVAPSGLDADDIIEWNNGLNIHYTGKVGIGTQNPLEKLQVGGDKGITIHDGSDKALSWNAYYDGSWKYISSDFAAQMYTDYGNDKMYFQLAPVGQGDAAISWMKFLTFQADGKFGIGTTNPKDMLQIGSGKGMTIRQDSGFAVSLNAYYNSGWKYIGADYAFQLYSGESSGLLTVRTTSSGSADGSITWTDCLTFTSDGNVAIGTTDPEGYMLAVAGDVIADEFVVNSDEEWPDSVFQPGYDLPSLEGVEKFIEEKGRLPGIPTAEEVAKKGINVGDMQIKLLQKIEELTLYMIELKKENKKLKEYLSEKNRKERK